jgi:hypothetical protein
MRGEKIDKFGDRVFLKVLARVSREGGSEY